MEIIMKTDMEKIPKAIEYNHEELKKELAVKLEKYNSLVVTEDGIKDAKTDRASLNKLKTALDEKRKEVKKQCLVPYEFFEKKINEIIKMVDGPISAIDVQLREYEKIKKDEKSIEVQKVYDDCIGDFKDLIPLEKIWDKRWLNLTYKLDDVALEIEKTVGKAESSVQIIKEIGSDFEQQILNKFFETLDIQKALSENARLKAQKEKQEEYERKQAEKEATRKKNIEIYQSGAGTVIQKAALTRPEQVPQTKPQQAVPERPQQSQQSQQQAVPQTQKSVVVPMVEGEYKQILDFRVWVSHEEKILLRNFLVENKIKFGRVE